MRYHDWVEKLLEVMADHERREFVWGQDDCCLFVARCIDAMTGSEVETAIAAEYDDEPSALRLIAKHGGLAGAVIHFLGEPVEVYAGRGDVVLIDGGEGDALGICLGSHIIAMGPDGLRRVPRKEILKVWRV